MKRDKIHFCDIAPVVPIPPGNRQVFSYLSEVPIARGSLVWIPFGPRTIQGVALSCSEIERAERPTGRFKYVKSVMRESFLTDDQISLAEAVSRECLSPLGRTFRHFLPAVVKERSNKAETIIEKPIPFRLSNDERDVVRKLTEDVDTKPFYLEAGIEQTLRIIVGAKKTHGKKLQTLVLVPEIIAIPFTEKFLRDRFGSERVASIHSALGDGAYFSAWERIRSGQADIVVGTRQALFAPFRKLGMVALLEEAETVGYKQWDMSPRYDAHRVAATLCRLQGATLFRSGSFQGLDTALSERLGDVRVLHIGDGAPPPSAPITMIDMRKERYKKNYSLFSEDLRGSILEARRQNRKALLIASRGGLDSFSVCVSCKDVPRCPECDRALRSTREGGFRCPGCRYRTKSFPRCGKCGSLEFRNVGSGTEKIEREAARIFGDGSLVRIDETFFRKADRAKPYDSAISAGILIGTPSVLNIGTLRDVSLVAIMDADNFLSFPDFQGDERFLRIVARSALVAGADGAVFVQAFRPERQALRHIADKSVYELQEIIARDREALRYPPYYRVFRIAFRDSDEVVSKNLASAGYERLKSAGIGLEKEVRISSPMKPLVSKVRGRFEHIILVTTPRSDSFPPALECALLSEPKSWTFDPDPLSLL